MIFLAIHKHHRHHTLNGYSIIPTVGFSAFTISGSGTTDTHTTLGFVGGALVDMDFGLNQFHFVKGALVAQQGFDSAILGRTISVTFNYLSIPLQARYDVLEPGTSKVHLLGGLTPQYMISSNVKANLNGNSIASSLNDYLNRFDTMLTIGVGGNLKSGSVTYAADATFNQGLLPVNNEGSASYNQGFMVSTGVIF